MSPEAAVQELHHDRRRAHPRVLEVDEGHGVPTVEDVLRNEIGVNPCGWEPKRVKLGAGPVDGSTGCSDLVVIEMGRQAVEDPIRFSGEIRQRFFSDAELAQALDAWQKADLRVRHGLPDASHNGR